MKYFSLLHDFGLDHIVFVPHFHRWYPDRDDKLIDGSIRVSKNAQGSFIDKGGIPIDEALVSSINGIFVEDVTAEVDFEIEMPESVELGSDINLNELRSTISYQHLRSTVSDLGRSIHFRLHVVNDKGTQISTLDLKDGLPGWVASFRKYDDGWRLWAIGRR